jgi:ribonuclease P protein component
MPACARLPRARIASPLAEPDRPLMTEAHPEQLHRSHRMTRKVDFTDLRAKGVAFRGKVCLVVTLARPGEITRVSFVASKRSVGGAVQRNRARRRMREIVRRRWQRVPAMGYLLMFVAMRGVLTAPHQELATDVERVLAAAGALAPIHADEV